MKKAMSTITICSALCTAVCFCFYKVLENEAILAALITCWTTTYHFLMRMAVGFGFDRAMNNKADVTKKWYQSRTWEKKFYEKLHVKRWKDFLPTYDTNLFDHTKHSWDEIAQASCQAEIVHETIVLLSFVPIGFSIWFGTTMVFIITSVLAALFDLTFVMIQRYNRPRILKLIGRLEGNIAQDEKNKI